VRWKAEKSATKELERSYYCVCDLIANAVFCHPCSVTKTELAAHTETLLTNLFTAMTKEGSQENEYVMKGLMYFYLTFEVSLCIFLILCVTNLFDVL